MKYDYLRLYEKSARFYERRPKWKRAILIYNALAPFAFALAYLSLLGYGFIKLSPKERVGLLLAPALALFAVTVLRIAFDRPRPYDEAGAGIPPLTPKKEKGKSFPSRHLTSAAAIAVCFLPYFPVAGGVLLLLSGLLGYAKQNDPAKGIGKGGIGFPNALGKTARRPLGFDTIILAKLFQLRNTHTLLLFY